MNLKEKLELYESGYLLGLHEYLRSIFKNLCNI